MHRYSIKAKLTFLIWGIICLLFASLFLLNTFGLELFYRAQKVGVIKNAYESIDKIITTRENKNMAISDDTDTLKKLGNLIESYSNKYNLSVAVVDSVTNVGVVSNERDGELLDKRVRAGLFDSTKGNGVTSIYKNENYRIMIHRAQNTDYVYIECFGYSRDNQSMILMSTPVAGLKESVDLSNRFLLYIGIVTLILATIASYTIARHITKPIQDLAQVSERLRKLDFDAQYVGNSLDEIGVLGTNMNVMAQKLKETIAQLKEANALLQEDIKKKEEIDEMRREFIANVSHELKTPIALIQGYAEGLNDGLCEDEESRNYYTEVIMDEAEKMNLMVKQLLNLSALESGTQLMQLSTFDICELIHDVMDSTKILLVDKNVEMTLEGDSSIFVCADEFKIEEVVTNFVSNAIHHVSEPGKIEIELKEEDGVCVSIKNTGKNIPDEDLEHLWDKFYKVDKAHSRSYGGSGIGLSIVKAIVEAHHQHCGVYNTKEGVCFWFTLEKSLKNLDKKEC